jgi:hypothetical protein
VCSAVACGESCFLASHVPVSGLEMQLEFGPVLGCRGRVKLAPFLASEVIAAHFGYTVVGPVENGGLGGLIIAFIRK